MRLYCTPGGTWAGSEKDYKAAMKAEGSDLKTVSRRQIDVPVDKAGLMEFLTFHRVNPIAPIPVIPSMADLGVTSLPTPGPIVHHEAATTVSSVGSTDLDELFEAAPLARQLHLAATACENARARIK